MEALVDKDVFIADNSGCTFKNVPCANAVPAGQSPFEGIKGVKAEVTTAQLIGIIREGRAER